jgi:hypothetical protein
MTDEIQREEDAVDDVEVREKQLALQRRHGPDNALPHKGQAKDDGDDEDGARRFRGEILGQQQHQRRAVDLEADGDDARDGSEQE